MPAFVLLVAFIGVPLAEIVVFIQVGDAIGLWPTIAAVVATAVIGTALLRHQGLSTIARARAELAANAVPMRELFDGVCLIFAGALLLTPGFITDAVGFALLIPPVRGLLRQLLWKALQRHGAVRRSDTSGPGETIIETEFYEVDEAADAISPPHRKDGRSPWSGENNGKR
ncbi:MAG: FxsA family protein [Alphaproteobacteria bacterium]|nr:FxsA family protein [Alphaproteobacteria bacterium]